MRRTNGYYWCCQWTDDNGLITEFGNKATFAEIVVEVAANIDKLPAGEGKFVRKR